MKFRVGIIVLVVAIALWGEAGRARAAPVGVVAIGEDGAGPSRAQISRAMAQAGQAAGAGVDVDPFATAQAQIERGAVPRGRLSRFAQARDLARQGWNAYLAVDPELARTRLVEAGRAAEAVLALDGGLALYADVSLRLGAVLVQLGLHEDAARAFRLARALDPDRPVSIAEFAPHVVDAYQAAAALPATVAVELAVRPAHARLEVDGQDLVASRRGGDTRTVNLAPGSHVLVARAPGRVDHGRAFVVTAATGRVDLSLAPDPDAAAVLEGKAAMAPGHTRAQAHAALRGVVTYANLAGVVMVAGAWQSDGPALLGQLCSLAADAAVTCTPVIEVRYPGAPHLAAAAHDLWARLEAAPRTHEAELIFKPRLEAGSRRPRAGRQESRATRCTWCRHRWLWIGVGLGATALVAGSTWLLVRDRARQPVISVEPCQFGGCSR